MTTRSQDTDSMSIAEQASKEMDSAKLTALVEQLCSAVDNRKKVAHCHFPARPIPKQAPSGKSFAMVRTVRSSGGATAPQMKGTL